MEDKFNILREMNSRDAADTGATADVVSTTAAMIDIIEEISNKLERIAVACEQLTITIHLTEEYRRNLR